MRAMLIYISWECRCWNIYQNIRQLQAMVWKRTSWTHERLEYCKWLHRCNTGCTTDPWRRFTSWWTPMQWVPFKQLCERLLVLVIRLAQCAAHIRFTGDLENTVLAPKKNLCCMTCSSEKLTLGFVKLCRCVHVPARLYPCLIFGKVCMDVYRNPLAAPLLYGPSRPTANP